MSYFVKESFIDWEALGSKPQAPTGSSALYGNIKAHSPVPVIDTDPTVRHSGFFFSPKNQRVEIPLPENVTGGEVSYDRAHTLAHEVGHALHDKTFLGNLSQSRMMRLQLKPRTGAIGFGLGAGISASGAHRGWHALGLAATALPTLSGLYDEYGATSHGRDLMQQVGANATQLHNYDQDMRQAYSSYTDSAIKSIPRVLLSYGIGMGAGELIRHWRSKGKSDAEKHLGLPPNQLPATT